MRTSLLVTRRLRRVRHAVRRSVPHRLPAPLARLSLVTLLAASASCVSPDNPYDPDTDPARQARASVSGSIALVDPNLDEGALSAEAGALIVALLDETEKEVARAAGTDLDVEGGVASFSLNDVVPGVYAVRIDGLHSRFLGARPGLIDLLPGAAAKLGELRFVAPLIPDGQGTNVVGGEVSVSAGAVGARLVELFRLSDVGPRSVRTATTDADGNFRFEALSPGSYAVVASATGYTPAYAMDLALGEQEGASTEMLLVGDDALELLPVSAVIGFSDEVRVIEGQRYTRADEVTVELFAFGGDNAVTGMRLSTDPGLADASGDPLPFESFTASKVLALPDVEGPVPLYAQFEARSPGGFVFVSDVFTQSLVRDVTPPEVLHALVSSARAGMDGGLYLTADAVAPALEIDAHDSVSAVAGLAVVEAASAPTFAEDTFVQLFTPPGLSYVSSALALSSGDGEKRLFLALRDRAGNVSEPFELVITVDTEPPVIDAVRLAGGADFVLSASTAVEVETSAADVAEVAFARGGSEPSSFVPYLPAPLAIALEPGDGTRSIVARLRDFAGNESGDVSDSVVVDAGATVIVPALVSSLDVPLQIVARAAAEVRAVLGTQGADGNALLDTVPYAFAAPATLAATSDGPWRVFAQVKDAAGVESGLLIADVVVDTTPPTFGPSGVLIDRGASATRFVSVSVSIDAAAPEDVEDMAIATDGVVDSEAFQAYSPTITALLPPGDCVGDGDPLTLDECKTVCVLLRDAAGNVSSPACDGVRLDTTPPTTPAISPVYGTVRADTVEIGVTEAATDFDGQAVASYEITSPAGDFFEVNGEGPFRFRLRPNRQNELCVRGKDAAGNVGIEDCAVIDERTLRSVIANGIASQGSDVFGDFLAFAGRGGIFLHDLRLEPPESFADPDLERLSPGINQPGFEDSTGAFVRMAGDPRTLVVLHGPLGDPSGTQRFNVILKALDERAFANGQSILEGQLEGSTFDTDGRWLAYSAADGVYVHDLGPAMEDMPYLAPVARTDPSETRVSALNAALCDGTGPRVMRGVVVWCQLVGGVARVMRSVVSSGVPTPPEQISGADPVAPTVPSSFTDAGFMQPLISERFIAWVEKRASGNTLVFLEGGITAPLNATTRASFAQPMPARNCATAGVDRMADLSGGRLVFFTVNDPTLGLTDVALFDFDSPNEKAVCLTNDLPPQDIASVDAGRVIYRDTANNESIVLAELSRTRWLSANPELAFEPVTSGRGGVAAWLETRPPVCSVDSDCATAQGETCRLGACTGQRRLISLIARDLTLTDPEPAVIVDQQVAFFGPSEGDPTLRAAGERVVWLHSNGPLFSPPPFSLRVAPIGNTASPVVVSEQAALVFGTDPAGDRVAFVEHAGGSSMGFGVLKMATVTDSAVTATITLDATPREVPTVDIERAPGPLDPVVVWQRGGDLMDRSAGGELFLSLGGSPGAEVGIVDRDGASVVTVAESDRVRAPKVSLVGNDLWVAYFLVSPFGPMEPHVCRLSVTAPVTCRDDESLMVLMSSPRDIGISRDGFVAFTTDEGGIDEIVLYDVRARRRVWATPLLPSAGGRGSPDIAEGHLVWADASLGNPDVFEMVLRP